VHTHQPISQPTSYSNDLEPNPDQQKAPCHQVVEVVHLAVEMDRLVVEMACLAIEVAYLTKAHFGFCNLPL